MSLDGPVRVGQQVFAKSDRDGRWYAATVVQAIEGSSVNVKFQATGRLQGCAWADVRSGSEPPIERKPSNPPPLHLGNAAAFSQPRPAPSPRPVSPRAQPELNRQNSLRQAPSSSPPGGGWMFSRSPTSTANLSPRGNQIVAPQSRPPAPSQSIAPLVSPKREEPAAPPQPAERRRGFTGMGGMRNQRSGQRSQTTMESAAQKVPISSPILAGPGDPMSPRKLSSPSPITRNQCPQCPLSFATRDALVSHLENDCRGGLAGSLGSNVSPRAQIPGSDKRAPPSQSPPSMRPIPATTTGASLVSQQQQHAPLMGPESPRAPKVRTPRDFDENVPLNGFMLMKSSKGPKAWKLFYFDQEGSLLHYAKSEKSESLGWLDLDEVARVELYKEKGINVVEVELRTEVMYSFRSEHDDLNEFRYWQDAFFHYREKSTLVQKEQAKSQRVSGASQVGSYVAPQPDSLSGSLSFLELLERDADDQNFSLSGAIGFTDELAMGLVLDPASPRSVYGSLRGAGSPRSPRSPPLSPTGAVRVTGTSLRSAPSSVRSPPVSPKMAISREKKSSPQPALELQSFPDTLLEGEDMDSVQVDSFQSRPSSMTEEEYTSNRPVSEYEFSETSISDAADRVSSLPPQRALPRLSEFLAEEFKAASQPKFVGSEVDEEDEEGVDDDLIEDRLLTKNGTVESQNSMIVQPISVDGESDDTEELPVSLAGTQVIPELSAPFSVQGENVGELLEEEEDYSGDEEDSSSWDPPSEEWANDYIETVAYPDSQQSAQPKPRWGGVNVMAGLANPSAVKLKKVSRNSARKSRRLKGPLSSPPPKDVPILESTFDPKALLKKSKLSEKKDEEEKLKEVEKLALTLLEEEAREREKREADLQQQEMEKQLAEQQLQIEAMQQERRRLEELERESMLRKERELDEQRREIEKMQLERERLEELERQSLIRRQEAEEQAELRSENSKMAAISIDLPEPSEEQAAVIACPVCAEESPASERYCLECGSALPEVMALPSKPLKKVPSAKAAMDPTSEDLAAPSEKNKKKTMTSPGKKVPSKLPSSVPKKIPTKFSKSAKKGTEKHQDDTSVGELGPDQDVKVEKEAFFKKEKKELTIDPDMTLQGLKALLIATEKEKESILENRRVLEEELQRQISQYEQSLDEMPARREKLEQDMDFAKAQIQGDHDQALVKHNRHWQNQLKILAHAEMERVREVKLEECNRLREEKDRAEVALDSMQEHLRVLEDRSKLLAVRCDRIAAEKRLQRYEEQCDLERRKRIEERDRLTLALEEEEKVKQADRDVSRAAALNEIDARRAEGSLASESVIDSMVEEIEPVDVDALKTSMNEAKDRFEDARAAELLKEQSRSKAERGLRENYARKVSLLDDAEEERVRQLNQQSSQNDEEEDSTLNEEALDDPDSGNSKAAMGVQVTFSKGDSVMAKRRPQDTKWMPAKIEYATAEGKYLVSFSHNKSRCLCGPELVRSASSPPPASQLSAPRQKRIPKKSASNRDSQRETVVMQRNSALEEEAARIKKERVLAAKERDAALAKLSEERAEAAESLKELEAEASRLEAEFVAALSSEKKRLGQSTKKLKKEQRALQKKFLKELDAQVSEVNNFWDVKDFESREAMLVAIGKIEDAWEAKEEEFNARYEEEEERLEHEIENARERERQVFGEAMDDESDAESIRADELLLEQSRAEVAAQRGLVKDLVDKYEALETELASNSFTFDQAGLERKHAAEEKRERQKLEANLKQALQDLDTRASQEREELNRQEEEVQVCIKQAKAKLRTNSDETELQRLELEVAMIRSEFSKKKRLAEEMQRKEEEERDRKRREREREEELERQRQKEIEEELERVRLETERVERERQEQERRLEQERERERLEFERLEAERLQQEREEEAREKERVERERLRFEQEERARREAEAQEEELERQREEELQRQEELRIAMEEAEERARAMESIMMGEAPLDVAPTVPDMGDVLYGGKEEEEGDSVAESDLNILTARLEELIEDERSLREAILIEKETLEAKQLETRNQQVEQLRSLSGKIQEGVSAAISMGEALLIELDPVLAEGLELQCEDIFQQVSQLTGRRAEDERSRELASSIRNLRAALQLFLGQVDDALNGEGSVGAEDLAQLTELGDLLGHQAQMYGQWQLEEICNEPLMEVAVDQELVLAADELGVQIQHLQERIRNLMPPKPGRTATVGKSRRIKSTAPAKALPTLE